MIFNNFNVNLIYFAPNLKKFLILSWPDTSKNNEIFFICMITLYLRFIRKR